jgi:hypothetical protein
VIDPIWRGQVIDVLDQIGDRDFQLRSWTGIGPEVSSYDEVISQIMDDQSFADFCEKLEGHDAKQKCRELLSALNALDSTLQKLPPLQIIDDPRWINVRTLARSLSGELVGRSAR